MHRKQKNVGNVCILLLLNSKGYFNPHSIMKVHVTFEMFISLLVIVISFSYSLLVIRSLLAKHTKQYFAVLYVLHLARHNSTEPIINIFTSKRKV